MPNRTTCELAVIRPDSCATERQLRLRDWSEDIPETPIESVKPTSIALSSFVRQSLRFRAGIHRLEEPEELGVRQPAQALDVRSLSFLTNRVQVSVKALRTRIVQPFLNSIRIYRRRIINRSSQKRLTACHMECRMGPRTLAGI